MKIRPLIENDKSAWLPLWRGYQDFYNADLTLGEDALWERLPSDDPLTPTCLVADKDGSLLGLVHFLYHGTTWSDQQRIYLNDLYTAPEARGQGIGRALIEAVYKAADESNAESVYWLTHEFNTAGRQLYDKVAKLTPFIKYQR